MNDNDCLAYKKIDSVLMQLKAGSKKATFRISLADPFYPDFICYDFTLNLRGSDLQIMRDETSTLLYRISPLDIELIMDLSVILIHQFFSGPICSRSDETLPAAS